MALYQQDFLSAACYLSPVAVITYDYTLTFSREVDIMWRAKHKRSFSLALYYFVRYTGLFLAALVVRTTWSTKSHLTCIVLEEFQLVFNALLMVAVGVFSTMRVYALYYRNYWILGTVLFICLINPVIHICLTVMIRPQVAVLSPTLNSCGMTVIIDVLKFSRLYMGTRAASILADAVVLVLTWLKTIQYRKAVISANGRTAITTVLLTNGTTYFSALLFINILALGVGQIAELMVVMTVWITIMTSILTCRFMLDLRAAANPTDPSGISLVVLNTPAPSGGPIFRHHVYIEEIESAYELDA